MALLLAAGVTLLLAFAWTLITYYSHGFELLSIGQRGTSMVASQSYFSFANLMAAHQAPKGPEWGGIFAMGVGAAVTMALSYLRVQFLGFPLHPVGYLAANSWGMHLQWASFLIAWLIKTLVTRYGDCRCTAAWCPCFWG